MCVDDYKGEFCQFSLQEHNKYKTELIVLLNSFNAALMMGQENEPKIVLSILTYVNTFDIVDFDLYDIIHHALIHTAEKNPHIVQFIYFFINIDCLLNKYLSWFENLKELEVIKGKDFSE